MWKVTKKNPKFFIPFLKKLRFSYQIAELKSEVRGSIVLNELIYDHYSQARSHYCHTRGLLSAAFPPWTESPLLSQPGQLELPLANHIDARLSADARSP